MVEGRARRASDLGVTIYISSNLGIRQLRPKDKLAELPWTTALNAMPRFKGPAVIMNPALILSALNPI